MANLPVKLIDSLKTLTHFDAEQFIATHQSEERITSIRLNPFKKAETDFDLTTKVNWCENAFYLPERPVFTADPLFHAGAYYVQEAGSLFLDKVLRSIIDTSQPQTILDLCAAPGGKSTLINSVLNDESLLVANEVIKTRAGVLAMNLSKWGTANTIVTNNDPSQFTELHNVFDVIGIDAPCSGSGLFRKQPEAIKEWSEDNVMLCEVRQKRIVADVVPALKNGGYIIYSTCSYSPEENELQVDWLEQHLGLKYIPLPFAIPEGVIDTGKGYRFYSHLVKSEGFFIAVLQKQENFSTSSYTKSDKLTKATNKELQTFGTHVNTLGDGVLFQHQGVFKLINTAGAKFIEHYAKKLYIKKAGITLGELKQQNFVPDQELAWAVDSINRIPSIELTKPEALAYLKKENVVPETAKGFQGLARIDYKGLGLGFAKVLSTRLNNYFPAGYRIFDKNIGLEE